MTASKSTSKPSRQPARGTNKQTHAYHHGDLRASLLAAAELTLAKRGAHGLTLREVAKAAGVSHGAPYYHFASLNDLLAAVAERGFIALGDAMAEAVAVPDARERLLRVTPAYVRCALAQPERFRLMFGPLLARKSEFPTLTSAAQRAFGFVLAAGLAYDSKIGTSLATAGWSLAHGLSHLLIDGAFEGMPTVEKNPEKLARDLGNYLLA